MRRQARAIKYRRRQADARVVFIPETTKSRAGIKYTRFVAYLQRRKA